MTPELADALAMLISALVGWLIPGPNRRTRVPRRREDDVS